MKTLLYAHLLILGQMLLACQATPKQELLTHTSWKLVGVVSRPLVASKRDSIPTAPAQKQNLQIFYTFTKDKKYTFQRASQTDKGEWGISTDERVLLLRSQGQSTENSEFRIHTLNEGNLTVSSEHQTKQEILYFVAR